MDEVKPAAAQTAAASPQINVYARVALTFLVIVVAFASAIYFVFQANKESFMKYGLGQVVDKLERRVVQENGLSSEQCQECLDYLDKLKGFLLTGPLTKEKLVKYHNVATPFKLALQDGWVRPEELMTIRQAMWDTDLENKPVKEAPASATASDKKQK